MVDMKKYVVNKKMTITVEPGSHIVLTDSQHAIVKDYVTEMAELIITPDQNEAPAADPPTQEEKTEMATKAAAKK
jgi:hypothetical protein